MKSVIPDSEGHTCRYSAVGGFVTVVSLIKIKALFHSNFDLCIGTQLDRSDFTQSPPHTTGEQW